MDWRILYNPLAVLGKGKGLVAALAVVIVLGAVAFWGGVHLDGALDMHVVEKGPSAMMLVIESLTAWLCLGAFFFAFSKALGGNGGFGGHLAAAGLGRFPLILATIVGSRQLLGSAMLRAFQVANDTVVVHPQSPITPGLLIGGIFLLGLTAWSITVLYLGFRTAGKLPMGRAIGTFVAAIVIAEVVSKLILASVFKAGI